MVSESQKFIAYSGIVRVREYLEVHLDESERGVRCRAMGAGCSCSCCAPSSGYCSTLLRRRGRRRRKAILAANEKPGRSVTKLGGKSGEGACVAATEAANSAGHEVTSSSFASTSTLFTHPDELSAAWCAQKPSSSQPVPAPSSASEVSDLPLSRTHPELPELWTPTPGPASTVPGLSLGGSPTALPLLWTPTAGLPNPPDDGSPAAASARVYTARGSLSSARHVYTARGGMADEPRTAAVKEMGVVETIATLRRFSESSRVMAVCCARLRDLSVSEASRAACVEAGAIEAIVRTMHALVERTGERLQHGGPGDEHHRDLATAACWALKNMCAGEDAAACASKRRAAELGALGCIAGAMRSLPASRALQEQGAGAIRNLSYGMDEQGASRKQRAVDAGALAAITAGMLAHASLLPLQQQGLAALASLCARLDAAACARKERACQENALSAVLGAMRTHAADVPTLETACRALTTVCAGADGGSGARKAAAIEAGGLQALLEMLATHKMSAGLVEAGCRALRTMLTGKDTEGAHERKRLAADAGAIRVLVRALQMHRSSSGVQQQACRALCLLCSGREAEAGRRRDAAVDAGAMGAVIGGLNAHAAAAASAATDGPADGLRRKDAADVMDCGCAALKLFTASSPPHAERAKRAGALPAWIAGEWRVGEPPTSSMPPAAASGALATPLHLDSEQTQPASVAPPSPKVEMPASARPPLIEPPPPPHAHAHAHAHADGRPDELHPAEPSELQPRPTSAPTAMPDAPGGSPPRSMPMDDTEEDLIQLV